MAMQEHDRLRFVAHVDDADEPGEVLDLLALEPFIAGAYRFAKTVELSRIRAGATLFAADAEVVRSAISDNWTTVLSTGRGWTMKVTRWQQGSGKVVVTGLDRAAVEARAASFAKSIAESKPIDPGKVSVGFWRRAGAGAGQRHARPIAAPPWASIRRNYPSAAALALEETASLSPEKLAGRLLLLYGPPGTGKTSAVRALAQAWGDWCSLECILDPEHLLADPAYLMSVILGRDDDDDAGEGDEVGPRWRLLVLEDCDEVIGPNAKAGAGQALSRLLNLTDGLIGQGRRILVCITTNEDISRFHPAVVRPGRCLGRIEVGKLSPSEAAEWLGVPASRWPSGATLAELFAARDGHLPIGTPSAPSSTGQYL
ncbi:MAG: DUF5925 domain-containing protein [Acidimicrobiales bacterium]